MFENGCSVVQALDDIDMWACNAEMQEVQGGFLLQCDASEDNGQLFLYVSEIWNSERCQGLNFSLLILYTTVLHMSCENLLKHFIVMISDS